MSSVLWNPDSDRVRLMVTKSKSNTGSFLVEDEGNSKIPSKNGRISMSDVEQC